MIFGVSRAFWAALAVFGATGPDSWNSAASIIEFINAAFLGVATYCALTYLKPTE